MILRHMWTASNRCTNPYRFLSCWAMNIAMEFLRSIMRKAAAEGIEIPAELGADAPINEKEIDLIQKMNDFAAAVADAGNNYNPGGIANYCYELTKEFNQFYHDYSILNAESEAEKITRLVLAANVAKILKNGMSLLGIEVPERM